MHFQIAYTLPIKEQIKSNSVSKFREGKSSQPEPQRYWFKKKELS